MNPSPTLPTLDVHELFSALGLRYDLRAGTVRTRTDDRDVYLSTDMVRGIHGALSFEAGEAWGLVLHRCGVTWGTRVANRLWSQLPLQAGVSPDQLSVDDFVTWLEAWFSYHGWGRLSIDLVHAQAHGVVLLRLRNSLFREALEEPPPRADFLVAGVISALMSRIAGQQLGCLEFGLQDDAVLFAVTAPERLEALEEAAEDGAEPQVLLDRLVG